MGYRKQQVKGACVPWGEQIEDPVAQKPEVDVDIIPPVPVNSLARGVMQAFPVLFPDQGSRGRQKDAPDTRIRGAGRCTVEF